MKDYAQKYSDLIKSGAFKWEIHQQDSVQVHVYGNDMAVAIGCWKLKRNDSSKISYGRFTHVATTIPENVTGVSLQSPNLKLPTQTLDF